MEEEGDEPPLGSSALPAARTAAGAPPHSPLPSARPPQLSSAFRLSPLRPGGGRGRLQITAAPRGPEARARPVLLLPVAAGGRAGAAQRANRRVASRPLDSPARREAGGGTSAPEACLGTERGAYPRRARPTRWFSGEKCALMPGK